MAKKQYSAEQVGKLRQIDVLVGEGKSIQQACKEARITNAIYCWDLPEFPDTIRAHRGCQMTGSCFTAEYKVEAIWLNSKGCLWNLYCPAIPMQSPKKQKATPKSGLNA